jgi:hypothetical protein
MKREVTAGEILVRNRLRKDWPAFHPGDKDPSRGIPALEGHESSRA